MQITFCGAAGEVTGSCYLVRTADATVLVDCGMFQGHGATDEKNRSLGPVVPQQLDAVVVTHAHLDHTGRLPLLTNRGLKATVYSTPATADFARIVLLDSAHLQEADAERRNRKRAAIGEAPIPPLYVKADVERLNPLAKSLKLGVPRDIADGVGLKFFEAGHILGSSSVELTLRERGVTKTVVFSGDLGPLHSPILREFEPPPRADFVIQESTYGNRDHRPFDDSVDEFRSILRDAVDRDRKILIPAFAIGRSQQVIYHIAQFVAAGDIPPIPLYLDSPMAIEATKVYGKHRDLFDAEAKAHERKGDLQVQLEQVQFCKTADESRRLNDLRGPMVIIAGSGMCDGGRIVHHLRHNLPHEATSVVIVGYQTDGSLGRRLVNGAKEVRIFGEPVPVRASIHTLGGFSGHAGQSELLQWSTGFAKAQTKFALTHGEPTARDAFRELLRSKLGVEAACPKFGESIEL